MEFVFRSSKLKGTIEKWKGLSAERRENVRAMRLVVENKGHCQRCRSCKENMWVELAMLAECMGCAKDIERLVVEIHEDPCIGQIEEWFPGDAKGLRKATIGIAPKRFRNAKYEVVLSKPLKFHARKGESLLTRHWRCKQAARGLVRHVYDRLFGSGNV